ncbi:DUF7064 domain-containing protein [Gordonia polyisoprenivorans]|uniref:DUF7064 domain-containing protein n=1 Tax=Gordonia polyisoprenivorans TaxID=84595 RepID=UPI000B99DF50|nr:hypothetical protein [Gordonia polyisoprenivorans]OZC29697.1 hypothetical protein CJJ17_23745 [Gordonia polyisoprenivorans]
MITVADEQMHPPTDQRSWQESYYFNWADVDGRSFGLTRIGLNPADGTADALLILVRDGRLEYVYPGVGIAVTAEERSVPAERGLTVGRLAYTMREPFQRWRIELSGRTKVALTWTAAGPPHDFSALRDASDGAHHFEQVGTVEGTVSIGGRTRHVEALGHRDKSWGVRDWASVAGWEWLTAQFGSDFAFNATLALLAGSDDPAGFVFRDGENRAVTAIDVDYTWGRRSHVPETARISLCDEDGTTYAITATAITQVPLVKKGLFLQETHARFETVVDGVPRTGHGVLEHAWHADGRQIARRVPDLLPVIGAALKGRLR